jgi:NAD(P)-dependent dehydrogenase (short-subunit alcohol dehydrogenase family)
VVGYAVINEWSRVLLSIRLGNLADMKKKIWNNDLIQFPNTFRRVTEAKLMGRFDGRGAIVTGGALGIGGGCARRIAADGGSVLIVDVNEAAGTNTVKEIRAAGGKAEFISGDVSKRSVAEAMVKQAVSSFGRLDLLVQNAYAGADNAGSAVEVEPENWHSGMDLLVGALYLGAKYAVPAMEESGADPNFEQKPWTSVGRRHGNPPATNVGRIVNMASVHGLHQAPRSLIYNAGKAAVIGLTKQMAIDFGPLGVTVNAIAPGHIVTERGNAHWNEVGNDAGFRLFELHYPVRRTGEPEDIANAVGFLCSNEASFITGQVLAVDGGMTIQLQENLVMDAKDYIVANPGLKTHFDSNRGESRF